MYFWKLKKKWLEKRVSLVGEVTVGKEQFRSFVFEKVQGALSIVCTDGVTSTNVDNVPPLLKALDINPSQEPVMDLIRDALIDNFGEMDPLELDKVVQAAQEADELSEMDDCLEVAFKVIDFDEDGFITQPDIYQLMLRLGEMLADYALDDMLEAVDMDKDGKISLRDFRLFLLGRDVPSRKEIFAMAEDARKKRIQAEIQAEEDAERQKFEMLKSGECAPEPNEHEDNTEEQDVPGDGAQENGEVKTDNQESTGHQADHQSKTTDGDTPTVTDKDMPIEADSQVPVASDATGEDEAVVPVIRRSSTLVTPPTPKNDRIVSESAQKVIKEIMEEPGVSSETEILKLPGETQIIKEKREQIFPHGAIEVTPTTPDSTPRADIINNTDTHASLHLPGSDAIPRGRQSRRPSNASSLGLSEDEYDMRCRSPVPLINLTESGSDPFHLDVPPPDLSSVHGHAPSPMPTPLPTPLTSPRRRPSIVAIGGLAVGGEEQEAIELLRLQLGANREGNAVPENPHRSRRNSRHSVCESADHEGVNTVKDVEDFNNRLVFKLPPRRRSSTVPYDQAHSPSPSHSAASSRRNSQDYRSSGHGKVQALHGAEGGGADSDEGIGLADEEIIVKSVYVNNNSSQSLPPNASSLLRISLPSGDNNEPWVEHKAKPGALPPPKVTIDPLDITDNRESKERKPHQNQGQYLGVERIDGGESPRSVATRSDFSAYNTSLTSPRTDDGCSDVNFDITRGIATEDLRGQITSRTIASNKSANSGHECDADSVLLSIAEDATSVPETSPNRHVRYTIDEDDDDLESLREETLDLKDTPNTSRHSGKTKSSSQKASIPCNTIELKELELNAPVTANQFSNRKRFGMIPRDVSKFLVLGKTPAYSETTLGANSPRSEQRVSSMRNGTATSKRLSPTLRLADTDEVMSLHIRRPRPQTAATTQRERDILQNRRISLLEDEYLPLYDRPRDFDSPNSLDMGGGSSAIEIKTSSQSIAPHLKQMERRILKRTKTSFDVFHEAKPNNNNRPVTATPSTDRSERTNSKLRSSSTSLLRREQTAPRLLSSVSSANSAWIDHDAPSTPSNGRGVEEKSFARSVVPITRVVMAYQNVKKRRNTREFYSLSRELERSGKPFRGNNTKVKEAASKSPYALDLTSSRSPQRSGRRRSSVRKHGGGKRSSRSISGKRTGAEEELPDFPVAVTGDDVKTLVGDLSDPDVIPDDVIFERYRPYSAGAALQGQGHRHKHGQKSRDWPKRLEQSHSILTLELPPDARQTPKVKNVSLLSKLPMR